ncbi:hypothetical protein MPSEU_000311800 [Mayamaea pseudoterrestris]|nr:hypothetical protein MPSEU_000311800 [Mayamaea pseudoterrestris]
MLRFRCFLIYSIATAASSRPFVAGFFAMKTRTRSTITQTGPPVTPLKSSKRAKTETVESTYGLVTPTALLSKTTTSQSVAAAIVTPSGSIFAAEESVQAVPSSSLPSKTPPKGWENIYSLVEELRNDKSAPCDLAGCEALASETISPKDFRFQALLSLMLSSQTKDATVGQAVRAMQQNNVASVSAISAMTPVELNGYINKVGFHNNKTKYIKETVAILLERFDGDIPPDAKQMQELPGVGPKMAYICESVAWKRASGIGVDTHMHRLFNQLGWVKSKTPEQTRVQLEAWLPRERWMDVNLLWVGFGQEVQQFKPKVIRKALDCTRPSDALRLLKRCGVDLRKEAKKLGLDEEVKAALQK